MAIQWPITKSNFSGLIISCLTSVGLGTLCDILGLQFMRGCSIISNIKELFEGHTGDRLKTADIFKMGFSVYAVAVHSIAAIVTPMGTYILRRQANVVAAVATVWLQPFINVSGLNIISFIG